MKRLCLIFNLVAVLAIADAVTKELAAGRLKGAAAISVIPGFFNLAYVENRGCAWGMFQGQVRPLALFGLAALALLIWKRKSVFGDWRNVPRPLWLRLSLAAEPLLYAGIVGNVVDRLFRGYVIDFFDFHWQEAYRFPCFNVADVCISVAAGLLVLSSFLAPKKPKES